MSIETTTTDSIANDQTDDRETIDNPERKCGTLKDGKAYLRTDVGADGMLPAFVEFDQPIPFKEDRKRSYTYFPGVQFELSVTGAGGLSTTSPPDEIQAHLERLSFDRPTGQTAGEMVSFHSHDLLMSVGKTSYPSVEEFVSEAKTHGVNKAISVTSGNEPPAIHPGFTRLFLIHPHAIETTATEYEEQEVEKTEEVELPNGDTKTVSYTETETVPVEKTEYVPGIFGYTYLTRTIYTEDADGRVPKYIQDYQATGGLDIVKTGEPVPYAEQEGFDADGNPVDDEQETLSEMYEPDGNIGSLPTDRLLPADPGHHPALEAGNLNAESIIDQLDEAVENHQLPEPVEEMGRADLGRLHEEGPTHAYRPPEDNDGFHDGDVLALIDRDDEPWTKVVASPNLSVEGDTATTTLGPYRVTVKDHDGDGNRTVTVVKTR